MEIQLVSLQRIGVPAVIDPRNVITTPHCFIGSNSSGRVCDRASRRQRSERNFRVLTLKG